VLDAEVDAGDGGSVKGGYDMLMGKQTLEMWFKILAVAEESAFGVMHDVEAPKHLQPDF
jgi:hypothetical protein